MKTLKAIQSKAVSALVLGSCLVASQSASAQGLAKARGVLQILRDEILLVIPIVAVIALVILGLLYANKIVEKDALGRWAGGIVIAGSAAEIVAMLFT
jgi:type IV secretory pathway VirB2 component (pilin)